MIEVTDINVQVSDDFTTVVLPPTAIICGQVHNHTLVCLGDDMADSLLKLFKMTREHYAWDQQNWPPWDQIESALMAAPS